MKRELRKIFAQPSFMFFNRQQSKKKEKKHDLAKTLDSSIDENEI